DGAELLGETEGISILARAESMAIEAEHRSQSVPGVVHDLGKLEGLRQRDVYFRAAARVSMQEGVAKREIQAHVAAWIVGHLPEARDGLLDSCAAFSQERQMRPQRHACRGERHANAGIAAPRKGPVEGRAQIADVGLVRSEPLGGRPRLQLGLGTFKELSIKLGVASREVVE